MTLPELFAIVFTTMTVIRWFQFVYRVSDLPGLYTPQ